MRNIHNRRKISPFPCSLTLVKGLFGFMTLVVVLSAAGGCVLPGYPLHNTPEERQSVLEKLVLGQNYQEALQFLDKIEPERSGEYYKSQRLRITLLADDFEADIAGKAVNLAELDDLVGALDLIGQGLRKIPESMKLAGLREKLRQERDRRLAENEREMLLSQVEYIFSQIDHYGEQAKVEKPSLKTRWRINKMEKQLAALHPDLLDCGQQTSKSGQYAIAKQCLTMALKIKDSEATRKLLARINGNIAVKVVSAEEKPVVLISATKKSRPAASLAADVLELETKLKQEIDRGDLLKAYGSLAKLEEFSGRSEQVIKFRELLDGLKESRVAQQMEEGSVLYRQGKISEARGLWQQVLLLDPGNITVREKIDRADKVLGSILALQKAQQKTTQK